MTSAEGESSNSGPRTPCWGIGLGRTGTNSLCEALRTLGYTFVGHNPRFEELRLLEGGADNGVTLHYKYLDSKFPGSSRLRKKVTAGRDLSGCNEKFSFKLQRGCH